MQYLVQYDRTGSLVAVVTPSLTRHEFSRQSVAGMTRVRYQLLTAGASSPADTTIVTVDLSPAGRPVYLNAAAVEEEELTCRVIQSPAVRRQQ